MQRNSSYINRIAESLIDGDDYDYIYDPEHKERPPSGYFKTEHGWSNFQENPQQQNSQDSNLTTSQKQVQAISPYYDKLVESYEFGNEKALGSIQKIVNWSAKQMGYDLVAYHGSNNPNIEVFNIGMNNAIFVAQERKEAFLHTKRRDGQPKIYPLVINSKKLFDFRDPKNKELIKKWVFFNPDNFDGHYTYLEPHSEEIKAMGYDGFYLTEGTDTYEKPNIAIFDPSKIKSIEPIVYRNRKVVPLSERFNPNSNSIYN